MRFLTSSFIVLVVVVIAAGAAPAAYAKSGVLSPGGNTGGSLLEPGGNTGTTLINPLGEGTSINSFLLSILSIITDTIGPVIVILMLVFVGFKFVTARGEPAKISEARQMLLWTIVGALILLGAKVIAIGIKATVQALSTGG